MIPAFAAALADLFCRFVLPFILCAYFVRRWRLSWRYVRLGFLTFGYGFLEKVGFPHISWFVIWPIMAVLWVIGQLIARRRYAGNSDK